MANNGRDYEEFVASLQQVLIDSEDFLKQKNITIERNKKITDNCGIDREFDLYWECEFGGILYKTIIECKDYASSVTIDKIDALIGKIRDIPDIKPVFATKTGYQSGAETKAKHHKIDLLIIREQNDDDWRDSEGNPLLKKIEINMHILSPAIITNFQPFIDKDWMEQNTEIDLSKPLHFKANNNEIFIEDRVKDERYSLLDLGNKLGNYSQNQYGKMDYTEEFDDAYIKYGSVSYKLRAYKVEYEIYPPSTEIVSIDFGKKLIGVIEYLIAGKTTAVFENKIIKDWKK